MLNDSYARPPWIPNRAVDPCGVMLAVENVPIFVEYAQHIGATVNLRLNGTPLSLVYADTLLHRMPSEYSVDAANTVAFAIACYAGFVFAQATGATWFLHGENEGFTRPALWLNGLLIDPVAQVFYWKAMRQEPTLYLWFKALTENRLN